MIKPVKSVWISATVKKIMKEGVRSDTHAPLSASNPRQPVSDKQAVAIAESMYERKYGK